jgi:hypothetical protein
MSERWFAEGCTVLDENRLPVAHVVGQEEDNSEAVLMAAAPEMRDALAAVARCADVPASLREMAERALAAADGDLDPWPAGPLEPESDDSRDWRDAAADAAGVPRSGEI